MIVSDARLLLALLVLVPGYAAGQEERLKATVTLEQKVVAVGEVIKATIALEIQPGYHTYATTQADPKAQGFLTKVKVKEGPLERGGEIQGPKPHTSFDKVLECNISTYEDNVILEAPFKVKAGTAPGKHKVLLVLDTAVCAESCQPFNEKYEFEITVKAGQGAPPVKQTAAIPVTPTTVQQKTPEKSAVDIKKSTDDSKPATDAMTLGTFLGQAVFWGFLSLLTPCVFPMIPITVSFFLKQKEDGNRALIHSVVYTLTIIIALSVFILFFVEAAQKLTYHWGTNLFMGLLLLFFALSLFGMYEITLPGVLTRLTSRGESKGGYIGTFFMAMSFILISFSCVAPFVGGFAAVSAQERPFYWNLLGAVTFATCFGSPFFLLSIFPSMLKKLPKSGGWMNSLKVVLGVLEVAAALKFLRQSELNFKGNNPDFLTYDVVISLYVGLCLVAGLYLFKVFRMPHDHADGQSNVGVGRFLWGCVFISLGIYLFPALFRGPDGYKLRPSGQVFAWVDAFLLQGDDTKPLKVGGGVAANELKWIGFLNDALKQAKEKKTRIFVDFTGINCQNCAINEKAIFILDDVKDALNRYTLLKLYTDTVPLPYYPIDGLSNVTIDIQEKDAETNRVLEKTRFNTTELPFYAVIEPDGNDFKILARYSVGLIRDKDEFLKFLRENVGK